MPRSATIARSTCARGFTVTENGITVIAKADGVERFLDREWALTQ